MRRVLLALLVSVALAVILPASVLAGPGNPNGTGPPSQSCEAVFEEPGGHAPGKSAASHSINAIASAASARNSGSSLSASKLRGAGIASPSSRISAR